VIWRIGFRVLSSLTAAINGDNIKIVEYHCKSNNNYSNSSNNYSSDRVTGGLMSQFYLSIIRHASFSLFQLDYAKVGRVILQQFFFVSMK